MKVIAATLPLGATALSGAAFAQAKKTVQEVMATTETEIQQNKVHTAKRTQSLANDIASETQKYEDAKARRNRAAAAEDAAKDNAEAAEAEEKEQATAQAAHRANMEALTKADKIKSDECKALKTRRTEQKRRMAKALETLEKNAQGATQGGKVSQGGVTQGSASTFESQTDGIVKIFEKLLDDISSQLQDETDTCQNFKQNFNLNHKDQTNLRDNSKEAKENAHDTAVAERSTEAQQKTEKQNQQAQAVEAHKMEQQLTRDSKVFNNNQAESLSDLQQQLAGLEKVMGLINSKVAGAKGLVFKQATSLMQLMSEPQISGRVQSFLNAKGFSALAKSLVDNPLSKVKSMISDMINKLEVETANEEKQHGDCTNNLDQANNDMKNINDKLDTNSNNLDKTESAIQTNKEDISQAENQIAELTSLMQTSTEDRADTKSQYDEEIAALTKAIEGMGEIITLISTETTEAVQEQLTPIFESLRTTMRTTETNKRSSESTSVATYNQLMKSSKASTAKTTANLQSTQASLSQNEATKASLDKKISSGESNKQDQKKILLIVQKKCNNRMTHGEKIAHMKQEIESLTQALSILEA